MRYFRWLSVLNLSGVLAWFFSGRTPTPPDKIMEEASERPKFPDRPQVPLSQTTASGINVVSKPPGKDQKVNSNSSIASQLTRNAESNFNPEVPIEPVIQTAPLREVDGKMLLMNQEGAI
jgi:hypothetical protein